jgi:hypothetical protein
LLLALIGKGYCLHLRHIKVDFINLEKDNHEHRGGKINGGSCKLD